MKTLAKVVATFFGLGYFPVAPGTLASLAFLLLRRFLFAYFPPLWLDLGMFIIFLFSGVWASQVFALTKNKDDPRQIVIDEVCGQSLAIMARPSSNLDLLLAFIFFRGLDIIKPYPINKLEKIKGGWGIMADDLAAGLLARFLLEIYFLIF